MPSVDQITAFAAQAGLVLVAVSLPLGLLGTVVEHFGRSFELPAVEKFGDKLEKFFFDLPGLVGK